MSTNQEAKKFSFWFRNKLRERIEALGYKPTRFISEAILEKLAREEGQITDAGEGKVNISAATMHISDSAKRAAKSMERYNYPEQG